MTAATFTKSLLAALFGFALMTLSPAHAEKTLFIGDSITLGQALADKPAQRWTGLVSKTHGWIEVNEGKGGRPSSALDEIRAVIAKHKGDAEITRLVIALGANDARNPAPDIAAQVAHNVGDTIELAHQSVPKWKIILCGPYNINRNHLQHKEIADMREKNLVAIDTALQELAKAKGCPYVHYLGIIPPQSLTADGVHPDAVGHAALSKAFLSSISP